MIRRVIADSFVLVILDAVRGQSVEYLLLVASSTFDPFVDNVKHHFLDLSWQVSTVHRKRLFRLTSSVMEIGMEETLQDVFSHMLGWDARVVPSPDHGIHTVLDNSLGDLSSWLVQDEREMVLGKERMGRIGCVPVVPDLILIMRINDSGGRGTECIGSSAQKWLNVWLKGGNNED